MTAHSSRFVHAYMGAILIALGAVVILGWLLHIPELVRVVPGFAAMVPNTALCFMLMGVALALDKVRLARHKQVQCLLGGTTAVIAALVLSQDLFSIDLGVDNLFSSDWLRDERQHHTRMALNTAAAFILSGVALILLNLGSARWASYLTRLLVLIVGLIGLAALLGYALKLEFLFAWYPYARMALHTASGLIWLSIGLWFYWRHAQNKLGRVESPDARILFTGSVILVVMALTAGIGGFLVLVQQTEAVLKRGLHVSLQNRVEVYRDSLNTAVVNARDIASRPSIQRELEHLRVSPGHGEALKFLQRAISTYIDLGMSAVALYDTKNHLVTQAGDFARAPTQRIVLHLSFQPELLWSKGLIMRTRVPVMAGTQLVGTVVAEQPLALLTQMFENVRGLGETGEMVLCAMQHDEIACFPTRLRPEAFTVPRRVKDKLLAVAHALDGFNDVSLAMDYRGNEVIAAYSPIHRTGLGMVIKMNVEEVYQPINRQFQTILMLLFVLTISGMLLLRWQVLPLARRLVVAERETRERETRFRALLEAAPDAVVVAGSDGRIVLVNSEVETLFGYGRDELIGQPVELLQPERYRDQYVQHRHSYETDPRRRAMGSGLMLRARRKDGSEFPIEVSLSPLQTENGLIVISAIRDVSERQRMQQEITDKELFLRSVIDNLPAALFCKDVQSGYRFTLWNNKSEEMFGFTREQVMGKNDYEFFSKEHADFFRQKDEEVMQHGRIVDIPEEPIDSKSLGRIYLHTRKVPVPDSQGKPHYLLGISEDITQRKRTEDALRASEERLRAVMENATDGIVTINEQGLIESFNAAATKIFGYRLDQVIGQNIQILMPESLRSAHVAGLQRYLGGGDKHVIGKPAVELQGRRYDGSEFPVELGINEVYLGEKRIFIGILRDITERKKNEETIRALSLIDELTGLRNRRGFMTLADAELLLARRMKHALVLFYADLDGMKTINDKYGHVEGDNALRDIADILRATFRDSDIVARLGGDEFAILALEATQRKPEIVIQRLEAKIAEHNRTAARRYSLSLSIGAVQIDTAASDSMEMFMARADAEMYRIKRVRRAPRRNG